MSVRSDGSPSSRADAPVAMMSDRVSYSASDVLMTIGIAMRSTDAT